MARSQDDLALGAYGIRPSKRSVEKEILEGANLAPLQTCGWKLESTYRQPKISQHPASDCLLENAELVADLAPGDRNLPELAQQIPALPSQTRPPQDIEQPRPTQPLPEPPPSAPSSAPVLQLPPPIPTPPEPSAQVPEAITIKGFNFEGNTAISDAELNDVVKKYLNQRIPFATVFEVRSAITKHYTEQGYVNSGAIIPPQTFRESDGILTVQIIEGSLEAIEVRGTRRLNPDYIRNRIALAVGKPVNQRKLTEALRLLQLDPLIKSISAELTAGTQTASGLLIVQVEEAKTISLNLALNNNRSPTIGTFERRLDFLQANLFGQGDGLAFSYSNTDGSNALDATYTYPINPRNGTVSFRTNFTFGHVVESPFDRIDIDANSRYFELGWRQPLTRSLNQEFAIGVLATNQRSKVTIFDVPVRLSPGTEEDGSTTVTALRFFQEWTQRSRNQVFAVRSQFSLGLGVLGATVNKDAPDSRFLAWRGQTQWVRFLAPDTPLILRGDVQVSTDPLLRLEQYGLGGFDTVRGYRENLFLSDNGASASAEVRFPILRLPKQNGLLQIAPFFDAGYIWNNSGNPDPEPDPNSLASVGLGLRFQLGDRLSARVDYGIPLIDVKSSQTTLQDSGLYFSVIYRIF
jgi:hemolysin activation/secretion protein